MTRFGLCCIFIEAPIKFRIITAKTLLSLDESARLAKVSELCLHNVQSLETALETVNALGVGAFRILSSLFPRYTHPEAGYSLDMLPDALSIRQSMKRINTYRRRHDIRLSFHPDQFVVLSGREAKVVEKSILEIEYQTMLARELGAEVINIHGGGAYGDKAASLKRLMENYRHLSAAARKRVTLENDDVLYTPSDLLPVCRKLKIPLVYDVHHHRCNPDSLSIEAATREAAATWKPREQDPYFHISSPKHGWDGGDPKPHADYINPDDIPDVWRGAPSFTVDIEAKAKEKAVVKIMREWNRPHEKSR